MTILYLISSRSHASGGHFHSLDQISKELGKFFKVNIITIGKESPILKINPAFRKHFRFPNSYIKANQFFKQALNEFNPDVIHCFDTDSLNLIVPLPTFRREKIVLNKCGGPNPYRSNWQYADNMVMFSMENFEWFRHSRTYNDSHLYLIPNRVSGLQVLSEKSQTEIKVQGKFNFIRIQRIGAYDKTILDALRLIEKLNATYPVHLHVVGTIQSDTKFRALQEEVVSRNLPVSFITDKRAAKASDLLYLADAVIGTGRSFMEASSLGLPVLAPAINSQIPILVDNLNFEVFFRNNFSERTNVAENILEENFTKVTKLLTDTQFYKQVSGGSKDLFIEFFGTDKIHEKYKTVYETAMQKKPRPVRLIAKNFPYIVKYFLGKS